MTARARGKKVRLEVDVEGDADLLLERWALKRKADLFTSTFGLEVELDGADG